MSLRYDTVLELVSRVSHRVAVMADDPRFHRADAAVSEYEAILDDEFSGLFQRSHDLHSRTLADVLGDPLRIDMFAQLLALRAECLALAGDATAAKRGARRALELALEAALRRGELGLDADTLERLIAIAGDPPVSPELGPALDAFRRGHVAYR